MSEGNGKEVTQKADRQWPVRNDQIVALAAVGVPSRDIAKQFGMSKGNVNRIVNDPRGQAMLTQLRQRWREKILEDIEGGLDVASKLAVKAVLKTLKADIPASKQAKANQDRVAIKILQGRGFLPGSDGSGDDGGLRMSDEQFGRLVGAIEKSSRVQEIDPFEGRVLPAEVVEEGEDADTPPENGK